MAAFRLANYCFSCEKEDTLMLEQSNTPTTVSSIGEQLATLLPVLFGFLSVWLTVRMRELKRQNKLSTSELEVVDAKVNTVNDTVLDCIEKINEMDTRYTELLKRYIGIQDQYVQLIHDSAERERKFTDLDRALSVALQKNVQSDEDNRMLKERIQVLEDENKSLKVKIEILEQSIIELTKNNGNTN